MAENSLPSEFCVLPRGSPSPFRLCTRSVGKVRWAHVHFVQVLMDRFGLACFVRTHRGWFLSQNQLCRDCVRGT